MEDGTTRFPSKIDLFSPGLTTEQTFNLTEHYSIVKHVGNDSPSTFIFGTMDDSVVPSESSMRMTQVLRDAKV